MVFSRTTFLILISGAALTWTAPSFSKEVVDKIIAVVNSEPILQSEVTKFADRLKKEGGIDDSLLLDETIASLKKDPKKQLDYLIREKMIESEVKKLKLEVGDDKVDSDLANLAKRNQMSKDQLAAFLKKQGYTVDEYKKFLKKKLERQNFFESEIISKLRITDEDAYNEFLKKNPKYVPSLNEFTIAQIFFSNKSKSKQTAKERAENVSQKIKSGEIFEDLADRYDEGSGESKGGYLGVFKAGEFLPEIEKVIQGLTIGQVSDPVPSKQGYHIVKVLDKKNSQDPNFVRVKEQIKSVLVGQNFKRQLKNWFESKKQDSYIKIN